AGVPLGLLASTGVMAWCKSTYSAEDFLGWGWRIPFYLSGLLIVIGLLIRLRIMETPLFAQLKLQNQVAEAPVRETLTRHWREILLAAGTRIAEFFTIPLFGIVSDRRSRRHTYMAGCLFMMLFALPFYALLETRQPGLITLAIVVALAGCHALLYSVQAALIPELFSTRLRCTGASIGYQLGAPLAGGLAPLIAAMLVKAVPGHYWPL